MADEQGKGYGGSQDRPAVVIGALVAAISLGYAIELGNGYYGPEVLKYLVLAAVAPVLGLMLPPSSPWQTRLARCIGPLLAAGIVLQASMLTVFRPAKYLQVTQPMQAWGMHACVWSLVLLAFAGPQLGLNLKRRTWAIALTAALLGAWLLAYTPHPQIDVYVFAQDAGRALLRGENPFAMTFANIYPDGSNYHPDLLRGGRVQHGFPYPPGNLIVALGDALTGDPRATMVVALAAAAWCMMVTAPSARALQATCLLLLTPRCLFLLEQCFMEPLAIFWLAATAWASRHRPAWVPLTLAWLLTSKQTLPFLAGATWLLPQMQGTWPQIRKTVGTTLALGTALIAPFFIWNPHAMIHSLITTHVLQQKEPVSLTLAPYLSQVWGVHEVPILLPFALLAGCTALLWRYAPRTPAGFCFGFGLSYLALLLVNRQGFANYHHMIIASFCAAAAISDWGAQAETPTRVSQDPSDAPLQTRNRRPLNKIRSH